MANYSQSLRKWPDLYSEEYDRLQALGRKGRTAEENIRFHKLRDEARKASKAKRFEAAVQAAIAERAPSRGAEEDGADDSERGAPPAADPVPSSSPLPEEPSPAPAPEAPPGEERGAVPEGPDAGEPHPRVWRFLQSALALDLAFSVSCAAAEVPVWAPQWLRHGYLAIAVRAMDDWGILERLEALGDRGLSTRTGRTIVTVAGGPAIYGPASLALTRKVQAMKPEEQKRWIATILESAGVQSPSGAPPNGSPSTSEQGPSAPAEDSGSSSSSPHGTALAGLVPPPP